MVRNVTRHRHRLPARQSCPRRTSSRLVCEDRMNFVSTRRSNQGWMKVTVALGDSFFGAPALRCSSVSRVTVTHCHSTMTSSLPQRRSDRRFEANTKLQVLCDPTSDVSAPGGAEQKCCLRRPRLFWFYHSEASCLSLPACLSPIRL